MALEPSMSHAVVRAHLDTGHSESLLILMKDKVKYGIFPDDYALILMLHDFITNKNYRLAFFITLDFGRVYFASISDIQLDVSPSKNFWMQNRTKALELYYFPSGWMSPLDVQNGCALEH